ncbi:MAG: magnesium transporter [Oligoflexales bacterium]|nr:magnesium transporter [Oligoflexales bacterium]
MLASSSLDSSSVKSLLDLRDFRSLRGLFKDKETADIAEIFEDLELGECIALFRLVSRERRAELLSHFDLDRQLEFIEELPDLIVSSLLNDMDASDRTKLLEDLPVEIRNKILLILDPEESQVARKLLSYPEYSVGRLMSPDFLALHAQMNVTQALKHIHWSNSVPTEFLNQLFVVDEQHKLIGQVSLAALVVCDPPSTRLSDLMKKNVVSLNPFEEGSAAVEIFRKYDYHYIPVIDNEQRILGLVTADDLFDVAEEEATEDIQQFGGHSALEESYFQTPWHVMIKKRSGWLGLLFVSGFVTVEVLRKYSETLAEWRFLTFFGPLIISAGGNSGTQAASLIIRALAINEMDLKDVWRVLFREILIGVPLGCILGGLAYIRLLGMDLAPLVRWIIIITIIAMVSFGVVIGSMLPFLFKRSKLDPAVVSSPFITTLIDITGSLIFIHIALSLLK